MLNTRNAKRAGGVLHSGRPRSRGQAALRVIILGGIAAFVILLLLASTLKRGLARDDDERVGEVSAQTVFNGARAFRDLERVVAFGPRPPGSQTLEGLRQFIRAELKSAGLTPQEQRFTAATPDGPRDMVNLYAVVEGTKPGVLVVSTHYDTKRLPFVFVGANDGGSTTAWMLELARALGPHREGRSVWLTFFDGEESFEQWSDVDGLYGSRAFVRDLRERRMLGQIQAMVNVDMIGDRYLALQRDRDAPEWLIAPFWNAAQVLGHGAHFTDAPLRVEDDHTPFRRAGVPALDLIDFSYGGSALEHQRNWHTPLDTLDRVCAGSLQIVGDVALRALPQLDAALDARQAADGMGASGTAQGAFGGSEGR